jgi:hypothetical protein
MTSPNRWIIAIAQAAQSCLRAKSIIVPSFVSPSRGLAKARWYFLSSLPPG